MITMKQAYESERKLIMIALQAEIDSLSEHIDSMRASESTAEVLRHTITVRDAHITLLAAINTLIYPE